MLSFRHELNAGNAAAAFLLQRPRICMTSSAPGFPNGLTALAHAAILLADDPYLQLVRAQRSSIRGKATTTGWISSPSPVRMRVFGGGGVYARTPDQRATAEAEAMDSGKSTPINAVIDPAAGRIYRKD